LLKYRTVCWSSSNLLAVRVFIVNKHLTFSDQICLCP